VRLTTAPYFYGFVLKLASNVLCLDVGLCNTGVAVYSPRLRKFIHTECLRTAKDNEARYVADDNHRRYRYLAGSLSRLVKRWRVSLVVAEMPHGGSKSMKAATSMVAASALVCATFEVLGVTMLATRPNETKRLVRGKGPVDKQEVIEYVSKRYGSRLIPNNKTAEHIADAMACIAVITTRRKYG
jgi:Holliday junction resolvasome RuvABC endonuclease subunit